MLMINVQKIMTLSKKSQTLLKNVMRKRDQKKRRYGEKDKGKREALNFWQGRRDRNKDMGRSGTGIRSEQKGKELPAGELQQNGEQVWTGRKK